VANTSPHCDAVRADHNRLYPAWASSVRRPIRPVRAARSQLRPGDGQGRAAQQRAECENRRHLLPARRVLRADGESELRAYPLHRAGTASSSR
jgi:hypothetical protein